MMSTSSTLRRSQREQLESEGHRLKALVALAQDDVAPDGPLQGLTFVAKDMFAWPGHAYSRGLHTSVPFDGRPSVFLKQLVGEGAALLGFAEMTPLAYEPSGANPYRGRPLNPLNADYITGGSSSGSAALVAAGLVDFAVGSDTAGSVRIPAHCCGVTSWKPSFGLFCRTGSWPLAPSLDTLGLLARNVSVLLRIGQALLPDSPQSNFRLAIAQDLAWPDDHDHQRLHEALAPLHPINAQLQPIIDVCDDTVLTLLQKEAYISNHSVLESGELDPIVAKRLSHGASIPEPVYEAARAALGVLQAEVAEQLFAKADIIALPTMPCPAPRVAQCEPGDAEFSARNLYDLSRYTRFVNALGLPAMVLPLPARAGLMPSSVQLIARHGTGLAILRAAEKIESLLKGSIA